MQTLKALDKLDARQIAFLEAQTLKCLSSGFLASALGMKPYQIGDEDKAQTILRSMTYDAMAKGWQGDDFPIAIQLVNHFQATATLLGWLPEKARNAIYDRMKATGEVEFFNQDRATQAKLFIQHLKQA